MFSFFKKKKIISHLKLSGVIGNVGRFRQGIEYSSEEEIIKKAFSVKKALAVAITINSPGGSPVQSHLICKLIKEQSIDIPGGAFANGSLRVRTEGEKRLVKTFDNLEIKNFIDGGRIILKDIAKVTEQFDDSSILKFVDSKPAVELHVMRSKTNDALETSIQNLKMMTIRERHNADLDPKSPDFKENYN